MRRALRGLILAAPLALVATARPLAAETAAQTPALAEAWRLAATWTSSGQPVASGQFRGPQGIAVGADDAIYVADARLEAIHVLEPNGTPRALWDGGGALGAVHDLAFGAGGVLYASEPEGDRIHVLGPDGAYQGALTVAGAPGGLAWDAGELFVTTQEGREVVVLDAAGAVLRSWDPDSSPINQPWGIDVGGDGRVYVADLEDKLVYIFDKAGVLLGGIVAQVDNVNQTPFDVAVEDRVDPEQFVVTELHLFRVKAGVPVVAPIPSPGGRGIAVGPGSGAVMTAQDFRLGFTGVRHFADRRAVMPSYAAWGGPFAPLGTLEAPRRVTANADDRVFVLDTWPRVQAFDASGTPRIQFGTGGLQDLAAGLRGSVYGIDGRILTYWTEDGTSLWTWQPPSTSPEVGTPYGWLTHVDGFAGGIAALDTGDQHLWRLDFSGNTVAEWPVSPPDGFTSVADMALGADAVYLLNRGTRRIDVRDAATGALRAELPVPGRPMRLDVAPGGDLFVLIEQGWVWRIAPDGTPRALVEVAPEQVAKDLAAATDDRFYVALEDGRVAVFERDPAGTPPEVPAFADRCRIERDKTAQPAEIALGETVEIRLSVTGGCPLADANADILLLVDTSGSMSGSKMGAARSAVMEFIGQLDYSRHQVGLISFSSDVDLVQGLTGNPRSLIRAVPNLGDDSGTNMLGAVMLADDEFASSRARPGARQALIILSDGRPNDGISEINTYATAFRRAGREVYTIGLGQDVDRRFMRSIATEPGYYFEAPTEYDLTTVYEAIARRVAVTALLRTLEVRDVLPPDMALVTGSVTPAAAWDAAARTLTWRVNDVGPAGLALRYRVRPQEAGTHPTNVLAEAEGADGVGAPVRIVFPVPSVVVRAPTRHEAFLPVAYKQQCPETRVDVALVLDTSTSMREPLPGGGTNLASAVYAAKVFLGLLGLPRDRVGLVAFHGEATRVSPLTGDALALVRALDALPVGTGTRIDLGLREATRVLDDRAEGHLPAIVLLTDGNQSGAALDDVFAAADAARAAGIAVFTIGLGPSVDRPTLERVAGDPSRFHYAPTDAELEAIYRAIAREIPCR